MLAGNDCIEFLMLANYILFYANFITDKFKKMKEKLDDGSVNAISGTSDSEFDRSVPSVVAKKRKRGIICKY